MKWTKACFSPACFFFASWLALAPLYCYGFLGKAYAAKIDSTHKATSDTPKGRVNTWKRLIRTHKDLPPIEKLNLINAFFNQLKYQPDSPLQGSADVWLTPIEFLTIGRGDCEDFAIGKFFTARAMGIPEEKLRITYVILKDRNIAHMVLSYYPQADASPLILDNVVKTILPATQRPDLKPVYSFGIEEVWLFQRAGETKKYGNAKRLSKWRALLKRIEQERSLRTNQ
jgi:predicted transglutaminase-like cysteine proteinase